MTYASIEYAHIYADEGVGPEQQEAARIANRMHGAFLVMVDDYNVPNGHYDYRELSDTLARHGRRPDRILGESDLVPYAEQLLDMCTGAVARRQRRYYAKHGRYGCSLLVAASYAVRLGLLEHDLRCRLTGRRLIPERRLVNVLPDIYADTEAAALDVLKAAGLAQAVAFIEYVWTHVLNETTWERFRPDAYVDKNYRHPHPADLDIARRLHNAWAIEIGFVDKAIEVGCGPNMYPVLAAAPWVADQHVTDWSNRNLDYIREQIRDLDPLWLKFVPGHPMNPTVYRQSIYELPERTFDVVSMHFVAESITTDMTNFTLAMQRVARALKPGGHLLASFMLGSTGYDVAGTPFPAVMVDMADIEHATPLAILELASVDQGDEPLRPGYEGMAFLHAESLD